MQTEMANNDHLLYTQSCLSLKKKSCSYINIRFRRAAQRARNRAEANIKCKEYKSTESSFVGA